MTLVRFNRDLTPTFNSLFDSFFDSPIADFFSENAVMRQVPAVNIKENENEFIVELAAPGLKKEDFKISLEKDVLTISSEKEIENKEEKEGYMRREFSYNSFKRSFTLPEKANREAIKAGYDHGVLSITIPKLESKVETSKRIEIA
jgi:HSP20 family protein